MFFVGTFGMNFQMTSALMATEVFHGKGAGEYGLLGSIMAVGSLTGALLAARRPSSGCGSWWWPALVFGVAEIVAGLMPTYVTFALCCPLLGLSRADDDHLGERHDPDDVGPMMRGRVAALYLMIFMGGTPIGAPVIGWVGETFGARWTLLLGGALTMVGVAAAAALYLRHRRVLTGVSRPGNLFPRVWDNQTVARARTQS